MSTLESSGSPSVVERTLVAPPMSRVGPIDSTERRRLINSSPVREKYDRALDPESAHEVLARRAEARTSEAERQADAGGILDSIGSVFGTNRRRGDRLTVGQAVAREVTRTVANRVAGGIAADIGRSIGGAHGSSIGRAIIRGALGGLLRR